jgi:hypothetical protein
MKELNTQLESLANTPTFVRVKTNPFMQGPRNKQ